MTTIRLPDGVHLIVSTVLADILDAAGIAPGPDVVGRVRWLISERNAFGSERDAIAGALDETREERDSARASLSHYADKVNECGALLDRAGIPTNGVSQRLTALIADRADLERRLDATTLDRDNLVKTLETVRGERDDLRNTTAKCQTACNSAGIAIRADVSERVYHMSAELSLLRQERDDLARRLEQAEDERDALHPKPEGPVVVAPCPWTWDTYTLRANGKLYGSIGMDPATGMWTARVCLGDARVVSDERTARALLVAVAGYDPGVTFILTLRPEWTREDIDAARNHDLGSFVAGLLEGYAEDFDGQQHDPDPRIARRWWAGGYKALNLSVKDRDDDCPF